MCCASPGFLRGSHPQGSVCPVPSAAPAWCFSVNALSEDLLGTLALAMLPDLFVCFYLKAVPACPFTKRCIRPFSRTLGKQSRALFSVECSSAGLAPPPDSAAGPTFSLWLLSLW